MTEINNTSTVQRVDLSVLRKQRFLIDLGDSVERILELNTSDMGVIERLSGGYEKLHKLDSMLEELQKFNGISESDVDESAIEELGRKTKEIDTGMREIIDTIFESNVSEICCPFGSMYDPIQGKLRYEHIIETLLNLYTSNISDEMKKVTARMNKHTAKYTGR